MKSFRTPRRLALIVTWLALGCSGTSDADRPGRSTVLTISSPADADALIPPLVATTQGKQVVDLLFDHLAEPLPPMETGGDRGFRPQLAERWTWAPDSLSIAFTLDSDARWHDGTPVRAQDVRFSFELATDPVVASPHASNYVGIDSVTAPDSLTAVVWWHERHPEQFFQVAYNLAVLPQHLLGDVPRDALAQSTFASHPVGSGRFRFESWNRQRDLVLASDQDNYRGAPQASRIVWRVAADPTAASLSVLSGQADVLESVRGDAYTEARASSSVRVVEYGSLDYAYLLFNFGANVSGTRGLFTNRALRAALTHAVDREAVVANALDSLGSVALGPFTRAMPSVDTAMPQLAFDTTTAAALLDSLGWRRSGADGMRHNGRQPLRFEVLVPSSSAPRQRLAVLLQAQFRAMGVQMDIASLEPQAFGQRLVDGNFEAALNMWRTDPSPSTIRQVWGTPQGAASGANFGRYSNRVFDAAVDSAARTFDPDLRHRHFRRAYQTIVDDAAAIWLYEPRNFAAINARVQPVGLRADAWWADLSNWTLGESAGR